MEKYEGLEIDKEALAIIIFNDKTNSNLTIDEWHKYDFTFKKRYLKEADKFISTMPTWLKPTERK